MHYFRQFRTAMDDSLDPSVFRFQIIPFEATTEHPWAFFEKKNDKTL
jgi:hypothetical protein